MKREIEVARRTTTRTKETVEFPIYSSYSDGSEYSTWRSVSRYGEDGRVCSILIRENFDGETEVEVSIRPFNSLCEDDLSDRSDEDAFRKQVERARAILREVPGLE